MIKSLLRQKINPVASEWLKKNSSEPLPFYSLEEPPKDIKCDLACNLAMILAKTLKSPPRKIAQELSSIFSESLSGYISSCEIAGSGFLNLTVSDKLLYELLTKIISNNYQVKTSEHKQKVMIEFVSANPTGPLHIGHGRGAAIGDSLAKIYAYLGYNIQKEYYLNDVGNQIEMLGESVKARYSELKGEKTEFPESGYKGDYIKDIAKRLLDKKEQKNPPEFKEYALKEITNTIKKDLEDFDIHFDTWFSESTIATSENGKKSKVDEVCDRLKETGLAYENEGALWFLSSKFGDEKDRVLKRSDGRYTYLASDIAYHKNKIERGYDKLIDIWGADHHGYVDRMKATIQSLGKDPQDFIVILYQLVTLMRDGKPISMSTRSGEFVTLREVLNEVGKDACRFFFLLRAPGSHLDFDLEVAKKQSKENPVYYVQYVHARCCSIFKEAEKSGLPLKSNADVKLSLLNTPEERSLIKKLTFFGDILELCLKSLSPHHLTTYLMEVADLYHRFYEKCRVLGNDKDLTLARLSLVKSVASIIKNGLNLLGVSAPERM
ncbi:MAG: arginine--tRNA ligase [Endomicrobiales bacterium]|nr:arginine--tRNA ligase [Endomicrobiales bacterium]